MSNTPNTPAPVPPDIYAIFCGGIDQAMAQKIVNTLTIASVQKVKHVHLLFQSAGGYVGDGVFLYNLFRSIPVELTLYNVGQIASAGVVAYLGASHRKTATTANFMFHRSVNSPQFATSTKLQKIADTLILDDARTEAIIRERTKLTEELMAEMRVHDLYLSGEEAVKFGVADEIGEFSPPAGTQVYNMIG